MRRSPGIAVDEPAELEIQRMRRRHLKGVMAIERQVYPRPWSPNLFLSEMNELRNRGYFVAKAGTFSDKCEMSCDAVYSTPRTSYE